MNRGEVFSVGGHPRVDVRIQSGRVDIDAGTSDGVIEVLAEGKDTDALEIKAFGDTVTIRQPPGGWLRSSAIRLHLRTPAGSEVSISSASADVAVSGRIGELAAKLASGDIRIEGAANVQVRTASGDVRIKSVAGNAEIATASGDVQIGNVEGRIGVTLASGNLRIERACDSVQVNSASGDIGVACCLGDDINFKTVSGDIQVGLPKGIKVDADLTSLSGELNMPKKAHPVRSGSDSRLVRLSAKSISGDIRVNTVD